MPPGYSLFGPAYTSAGRTSPSAEVPPDVVPALPVPVLFTIIDKYLPVYFRFPYSPFVYSNTHNVC